jgi:acetolactate synthase-1/2/3 large subunit
LTTFNGFDLIPSEHPLFAGRIGTLGNRCGNFVLQSADLLLSIGSRNNVRQVSYNWENFGKQARKIIVDIDSAELQKPTLTPDLAIRSDAAAFIDALGNTLAVSSCSIDAKWRSWCQERKRQFPLLPQPQKELEGTVDAYCFMDALTDLTPVDVVTVAGNGTACVALFQSGRVKPDNGFSGTPGAPQWVMTCPQHSGLQPVAARQSVLQATGVSR